MVNNCGVIVQSYEEIPYLLWLLENNQVSELENNEFSVLNFGGKDLWEHLRHLFQNTNIPIINLSFEVDTKQQKSKNLKYRFRYYIFLKFKIQKRLKFISKTVFLTPFCAPHLARVLCHYKKHNKIFITIPALISKGYLTESGKINLEGSTIKFGFRSFIRLMLLRIFFGRHIDLVQLGSALEPVLSKEIMENCHLVNNFFSIQSVPEYDKLYLEKNYLENLDPIISKNKSVIFFDQHYIQRGIVKVSEYSNLLLETLQAFKGAGYYCYYKGHPDQLDEKPKNLENFVSNLPSFIPAEYLSRKNVIFLSITSGAISNNIGEAISISLIDLIPFLDPHFKENAEKVLQNKTKTHIYCPKDVHEIAKFLTQPNIEKDTLCNHFNYKVTSPSR